MSKANAGHIIVKGSSRKGNVGGDNPRSIHRFFTAIDKGSARPAFCYPKKKEYFEEEVRRMEKTLASNMVHPERRMAYEHQLNEHKKRLDEIHESFDNAQKIVAEDPDGWAKRREELAEQIKEGVPSRKDVKERRVNPFANLRREKVEGLEDIKNEYRIISRAMGEESNVGFLQKEK